MFYSEADSDTTFNNETLSGIFFHIKTLSETIFHRETHIQQKKQHGHKHSQKNTFKYDYINDI